MRPVILCPVVCLAIVLGCAAPPPAGQNRSADETAIRALFQRNAEAGNRQDVEGVVATYWPDGDAWVAGQPRASIRQTELDWQAIPGFRGWKGPSSRFGFSAPTPRWSSAPGRRCSMTARSRSRPA